MSQLASRLDLIAPSPTLALDSKANAMRAEGKDIISFGLGEPDFNTPEHIGEAAAKAIKDGFTHYTEVDGIIELKEAICEKFKKDNGLSYEPAQVVVSNGGKHTLYNICMALFQPGDEVIIPTPAWVSYVPMVTLAGATAVTVKTSVENGYALNPEQLIAAITPKTKALIINSPSNPTGMVYNASLLKELAAIILKHDLWVISDDIYEKIVFDDYKFSNLLMEEPALYNRTIIAHGLSKTYAMTGWRIGYLAGPKELARAAAKIQSHSTSNPCSISQKAAVAALTGPQDSVAEMVKSFTKRRDLALRLLNDIPGITCPRPRGAFYIFPDVSSYFGKKTEDKILGDPDDIADYLLEHGAALVPGSGFGDANSLRLSYAVSDENLQRGLIRVKEALLALK